MSTISRSTTWSDGQTLTAAALNAEFNNILNDYNGGITNANISASAAIAYSKLSLTGAILNADLAGSIAASKISGTAATLAGTETLSNKRVTRRAVTVTQSATPTINTDNTDLAYITGLAQAITSMTTNLSGTPVNGDLLWVSITDNGTARAIAWGASFESSGNVTLPTTTVLGVRLDVLLAWNTVTSKWRCIAVA